MIQIPYLSNVQSAVQSNAAFMKPNDVSSGVGSGLQELGQTVSKVGQATFDHGIAIQRVENERQVQELQLKMEEAQAQFQNSLSNDFNPETWESRYKQTIDGVLSNSNAASLAPEARAKFDGWKKEFVSKNTMAIQRDAQIQLIKRAEISEQTTVDRYISLGKYDEAADIISNSTIRSPEEKDASLFKILEYRKDEAKKIIGSEVELKMQDNPEYDATPELLDSGYNEVEINKYKLQRNKSIKQFQSSLVNDITEKISDGVYLNEDDALKDYPNISEQGKGLILNQFNLVNDLNNAKKTQLTQIKGETRSLIDKLKNIDESSEDNQGEYASLIGQVKGRISLISKEKDIAGKEELEELLKFATNEEGSKKVSIDHFDTTLDVIYDKAKFGYKAPEAVMPLAKALNDGILQDNSRLSSYGFKPFDKSLSSKDSFKKQIDHINNQYMSMSNEERQTSLGKMKNEDPALYEVFQSALSNRGETTSISWRDKEMIEDENIQIETQKVLREQAYDRLYAYKKENPDASKQDIQNKALEISKDIRRASILSKDKEQSQVPINKGTFNTKDLLGVVSSRGVLESDDAYIKAKSKVNNLIKDNYSGYVVSEQQRLALILHEIRAGDGAVDKLTLNGKRTFPEIEERIHKVRDFNSYKDRNLAEEEYWLFKDTENTTNGVLPKNYSIPLGY